MSRTSRRSALQTGIAALGLPGLLQASRDGAGSRADSIIFVNLAGGPSHLDTLDRKPDAPAETRGTFQSIQSVLPGLVVCEHLPQVARILDQCTLIRGISHAAGAHPQGQEWISTGNRPTPAVSYPALGSVVMKEFPGEPDLPANIAIPKTEWKPGYLGDSHAAFMTNTVPSPGKPYRVRGVSLSEGLTLEKVEQRNALLKDLDTAFNTAPVDSDLLNALSRFGEQAHRMITSPRAQKAFDVAQEPEPIRNRFAADELNQSCLLACRLVQHGTRFVTVTNQGWDTHLDNFTGHKRLLGPLDQAIPATLASLKDKGILKRTLVVVMGEFGRTPKINENTGRDHFPRANWCLMFGGGTAQGHLVGGTTKAGDGPDDDTQISPDDIAATIYQALGINPLTEYFTSSGRPVTLVAEGRVLTEVFA